VAATVNSISEVWHLFQIRKALLANRYLCLSFGPVASMHLAEIQQATASLLYINLVAILDDAMETQMSPAEHKDLRNVHSRITYLRDRGKTLDACELIRIKAKRNDLGHEFGYSATIEQLEADCAIVQAQLVAWGLVPAGEPAYTLEFRRTRAPDSLDPKIAFVTEQFVRIMKGTEWTAEWKQTINHHRVTPESVNQAAVAPHAPPKA